MKKILRLLSYFLASNKYIFYFAQRLAYDHLGENNSDITTNGELRVLQEFLPKSGIVFDVGANIGDWTNDALSINKDLNIVAFEPIVETYKILTERNFPINVKLENIALSNENGEINFYVYESSVLNSAEKREGVEIKKIDKVQTLRLVEYCKKNQIDKIDFLKIDVEGFEFDVLKGAQEMLESKQIKLIQFEYGGTYLDRRIFFKDVYDYLSNFGYSIAKIHHKHLEFLNKYEQRFDNFQNANYIAILK